MKYEISFDLIKHDGFSTDVEAETEGEAVKLAMAELRASGMEYCQACVTLNTVNDEDRGMLLEENRD